MDLELTRGNNAMNPLKFHWFAEFESSYVKQFDNGKENKFQTVIDHASELKYFLIRHTDKDLSITVDLKNGLMFINKHQANVDEFIKTEKSNIRLIYFRRHRVELNAQMQEIGRVITYFIGYQYIDKDGHNRKILLQLDNEGNIVVGNN